MKPDAEIDSSALNALLGEIFGRLLPWSDDHRGCMRDLDRTRLGRQHTKYGVISITLVR